MELTARVPLPELLLELVPLPAPEPEPAHKPETVPVLVSWKLVLKTPALQMSKSKEEQFSFTCRY